MRVTSLRGWLALIGLAGVLVTAAAWGIFGRIPVEANGQGILLGSQAVRRLLAPTDGVVSEALRGGDAVQQGDAVVRLRDANGQEVNVPSDHAGVVLETYVYTGMAVAAGSPVANVEPQADDLQAVVFVPLDEGKRIEVGMRAHVSPVTVSAHEYGVLVGQVRYVSPFPVSSLRLTTLLENPDLVQYLTRGGPVHEVGVQLARDSSAASGYQWSSRGGPPTRLSAGTLASAAIVLAERRPLDLLLPAFN